jgi:hypothetical protein
MVKRIDHTQLIRIINLGRYLMNTKEKKPKTKSKKDLLREIIEIDDRFDTTSLSRTNIANLKLVRDLVLKV